MGILGMAPVVGPEIARNTIERGANPHWGGIERAIARDPMDILKEQAWQHQKQLQSIAMNKARGFALKDPKIVEMLGEAFEQEFQIEQMTMMDHDIAERKALSPAAKRYYMKQRLKERSIQDFLRNSDNDSPSNNFGSILGRYIQKIAKEMFGFKEDHDRSYEDRPSNSVAGEYSSN